MLDINKVKLSDEVKNKYTILNNSFVQVAKSNPRDRIDVEVGDTKDLTEFQNQLKISRWDNEVNLSYRLIENEKGKAIVSTKADHIVWKKGNIETRFYDVLEEEGGKEMEISFLKKPVSNIVRLSLNTKDCEFFYQPKLTKQEILEGAFRPIEVEGSYAVYAKTPKTNWKGGKEYKCGKIGHIYRPKIIDNAGTEVWGNLHIENGILSVEIPQEFLDNAVYPVRHAAGLTFGYTSVGASGTSWANNEISAAYPFSPDSGGTLDSLKIYHNYTDTCYTRAVVYKNSDNTLVAKSSQVISSANEWVEHTLNSEEIVGSTEYMLGVWIGNNWLDVKGDSVTDFHRGIKGLNYHATNNPPDPAAWDDKPYAYHEHKYSIYATYTPSGGAGDLKSLNSVAFASIKSVNSVAIADIKSINGISLT